MSKRHMIGGFTAGFVGNKIAENFYESVKSLLLNENILGVVKGNRTAANNENLRFLSILLASGKMSEEEILIIEDYMRFLRKYDDANQTARLQLFVSFISHSTNIGSNESSKVVNENNDEASTTFLKRLAKQVSNEERMALCETYQVFQNDKKQSVFGIGKGLRGRPKEMPIINPERDNEKCFAERVEAKTVASYLKGNRRT